MEVFGLWCSNVFASFWMNTHLKDSWLMMGLEVIVGVVGVMVMLLRAPIVDEAKKLIREKLGK